MNVRTHLGALYVVMQVVPEGVDEVDGVVSGVSVGVTREKDWRTQTTAVVNVSAVKQEVAQRLKLTEGDVADVVPDGGVRVLQLQRRLPVAEQHLGGRVAGSPTLFELLRAVGRVGVTPCTRGNRCSLQLTPLACCC